MLTFPVHLFNPESIQLRPAASVVQGGESLSGLVDTIRTDGGGYWIIAMRGIELYTDDKLRAWQAWQDHLQSGVQQVLVPAPELRHAPRPFAASRPSQLEDGAPEDPYFPEAVSFATPWIIAKVVAGAALRATQLQIEITNGARLKGAERFAIDHPTVGRRIYRVGRILSRSGQQATVMISPPLREAVLADDAVDFDWPSVVAVMVPDTEISPEIRHGRTARVDITFRESFA